MSGGDGASRGEAMAANTALSRDDSGGLPLAVSEVFHFSSSPGFRGFGAGSELGVSGGANRIAIPTTCPNTSASLAKLNVCTGSLEIG